VKTLTFNAPAHHTLVVDGERVQGGQDFTVADDRAEQLLADPHVAIAQAANELSKLTRERLNELAAEAGVEDPGSLPNKDAVIAALEDQSPTA
jgi:hypothetical protein